MKSTPSPILIAALATVGLLSAPARAQPVEAGPTQGGDTSVTVVPGPSTSTTTYSGPPEPGPPQGGAVAAGGDDGFGLNRGDPGSMSAKGGATGQYVLEGGAGGVPQAHTVRRGDTLWGISGQYFKNPYTWPKIWAQNAQIQNPHWIYPGDRVALRSDEKDGGPTTSRRVPPNSVFLRNYGWVDDPDKDDWGELVGSPEDQMFLSYGDDCYIELEEDQKVELGQELQLFKEVRTLRGREAEAEGELVAVFGTVRVDRYNPKTHMVRAHIIEALDTIERGVRVGPIARKFLVVPPARNEKYVEARILTALYPYQMFGQAQILFIDRGSKNGVKPGNRFLAVRRGDRWTETLRDAGPGAFSRTVPEDDRDGISEDLKTDGPDDLYPNEIYGEIRVLDVRENTALAIVMESTFELERDTVLVMKKGF